MEKVTITFSDGSTVEADVNGNCFIVDEKPVFPKDLSEVSISGEEEQTIHHAEIIEAASTDGRYWFVLREIPQNELEREKMDSQILFTAVMTDTLIEED